MALANVSSKGNPGRKFGKAKASKLPQHGGEGKKLAHKSSGGLYPPRGGTNCGGGRHLGKA